MYPISSQLTRYSWWRLTGLAFACQPDSLQLEHEADDLKGRDFGCAFTFFKQRILFDRIFTRPIGNTFHDCAQFTSARLWHRLGIFRIVLPPGWHPHSQVHLPAAHRWGADGPCRLELPAIFVTTARTVSAILLAGFPRCWASLADPVAPRVRRERCEVGSGSKGCAGR